MQRTIDERMNDEIRARLKCADQLDQDGRLKASAEAITPIYSYDPLTFAHEEDKVDARTHEETWDEMLRLQTEGIYPAAFAAIKVPVLMVHGRSIRFRVASFWKVCGRVCLSSTTES
jgi:hypothetical protein